MLYTVCGDAKSGKTSYLLSVMASILQSGRDVVVAVDESFGPEIYEQVHLLFMRRLLYSCEVVDNKKVLQSNVDRCINNYNDFYNRYEFAGGINCCGRPEHLPFYMEGNHTLFVFEQFVHSDNVERFMTEFASESYRKGVSSYFDISGAKGVSPEVQATWGLSPIWIERGAEGMAVVSSEGLGRQLCRVHSG